MRISAAYACGFVVLPGGRIVGVAGARQRCGAHRPVPPRQQRSRHDAPRQQEE